MRQYIFAGAITLAAFAAGPLVGFAQTFDDSPSVRALEARLEDQRVAFRATIFDIPREDELEYGHLVAMGGAGDQGSAGTACFSCHGAGGNGDGSGAFPRLAGLSAWYMYKQMVDFASGERPSDIMSDIAAQLTGAEMEAVSSYYAVLEPAYSEEQHLLVGPELQWGGALSAVGSAERGIPACANCHGPQASGVPPSVPQLAGQYAEYLAQQLVLFREGSRDNDPVGVMRAIAEKMTDEDIEAVSKYLERIEPIPPLVPVLLGEELDVSEDTIAPPPGLQVETGLPGPTGAFVSPEQSAAGEQLP